MRQRGRAPQLPFIMSSTRSAVVPGSMLTALSCGTGGSVTLAHSSVMSCAAAGVMRVSVAMIMAHRRLPPHILQRLPAAWRADLERGVAEPVARGMSGAKLWRLPAVSQITGERYLKVAEGALAA